MTDFSPFLVALSLGLLSSAHCVGMCGGIMGALTMAVPAQERGRRWRLLLGYNLGRIASYSLMGALAGLLAGGVIGLGGALWLRWLAGLLLIAMALYLANWWRGLTYLENLGRYLWAYLQPLGKGLMPVQRLPQALLLGGLWGWLPCGLVYTALAYAMAQGQWLAGAGVMLAFGLGTLPAVLATGLMAQAFARLLQQKALRLGFALLLALFGLWTIWGGLGHGHHGDHGHHQDHEQHQDHDLHGQSQHQQPEAGDTIQDAKVHQHHH